MIVVEYYHLLPLNNLLAQIQNPSSRAATNVPYSKCLSLTKTNDILLMQKFAF